jgi:multidrug efflux pump subunit AcrA (membrane-fusion protein)
MKKFIIVMAVLIVAVLVAYRAKVVIEKTRLQETTMEERTTAVQVQPVKKGTLNLSLSFVGDVKGEEEVDIFPKASGKLAVLKVKEGDRVGKDQVVAVVDRDVDGVRFEMLNVVTPLEGTVAQVFLDEGAEVSPPSPGPGMGTAIMRVINMDQVKGVVNVTEEELGKIKPGQDAQVKVSTYPDKVFPGKVTLVSPVVDPLTRTALVEITLSNPQHLLKPGMFARVQVLLGKKEDVILIPAHAVMQEAGNKTVFVVREGKAVLLPIETGASQDGQVQVVAGLTDGDSLIVAGQYLVKNGEPVKVISAGEGEI